MRQILWKWDAVSMLYDIVIIYLFFSFSLSSFSKSLLYQKMSKKSIAGECKTCYLCDWLNFYFSTTINYYTTYYCTYSHLTVFFKRK